MAKQWKIRRGTSAENDNFTGAVGEVTMDTTNKTLRVHTDGTTPGGTSLVSVETLKIIYPVGAVYIGTTSTCPMATFFGTWELVSSGKALWTGNGSNANTTIEAGLPDHTHAIKIRKNDSTGHHANGNMIPHIYTDGYTYQGDTSAAKNASESNPIYGRSSTVQPPAYVVNVWRRTA
jgi:hypothetical protein